MEIEGPEKIDLQDGWEGPRQANCVYVDQGGTKRIRGKVSWRWQRG